MTDAREAAEAIALAALGWIASDEDAVAAFMDAGGIGPDDLRRRVGDPDMLLAVLDFLMSDDARVIAFCRAEGIAPERPGRAHALLLGQAGRHWT